MRIVYVYRYLEYNQPIRLNDERDDLEWLMNGATRLIRNSPRGITIGDELAWQIPYDADAPTHGTAYSLAPLDTDRTIFAIERHFMGQTHIQHNDLTFEQARDIMLDLIKEYALV